MEGAAALAGRGGAMGATAAAAVEGGIGASPAAADAAAVERVDRRMQAGGEQLDRHALRRPCRAACGACV